MISLRTLVERIPIRRNQTKPAVPLDRTRQQRFLEHYPAYQTTSRLDALRTSEYGRLDREGHVYLDYTGGSLYAESQLRNHTSLLEQHVFGNPHSKNLTSLAMTALVEQARESILCFFNAAPDEYMAIFTPNASGALRLIGEAYPFQPGDTYLLTADNHNSVNGIREFARQRGAQVTYLPLQAPDLRADQASVLERLAQGQPGRNNLFAYPAQSNFTGVQHPLEWIAIAQRNHWDVLLDAAAFAPTNRLDLGRWKPDFVDLSFYKIFGYPTGLGCLLARRSAIAKLQRPWYAGGTITFSSVAAFDHYLTPGPASFEDGTVNYLTIPAVQDGLTWIEAVGRDTIHTRVMCLTGWLLEELLALRHTNGRPLVQIYGPTNLEARGATVQFNLFDPAGQMHDCYVLEQLANQHRISLRAGCHCNPGAREAALGFTAADLAPCFHAKQQRSYTAFIEGIQGKTTGAIRASLGLVSTFTDVETLLHFIHGLLDQPALTHSPASQ